MKKLTSLSFIGCLLLATFWGLTREPLLTPEQVNINSQQAQLNHSVKPQRIVSLSPSNTEILFALGAGDRIVGVTSHSDYPAEAQTKPVIGGYSLPDVEKIVSLSPDIVIAAGEIQSKYTRILEQAGIRVVSVEPKTMNEVLTAIEVISAAIGEQERGAALCAALSHQIQEVRQLTSQVPPKRVFLELQDVPFLTVGGRSYINDIVTLAGGVNVAGTIPLDYVSCDLESLYAYNPEMYIVIGHNRSSTNAPAAKQLLAGITAFDNNQVYHITKDTLIRPGPRSVIGLRQLAQILHPEIFQ